MDYLVPTAMETPKWETAHTVTPSPHHPFGAKGVGESATVGAPPAIANAVVDALSHLGVTHIDIPITPEKVWRILRIRSAAKSIDAVQGPSERIAAVATSIRSGPHGSSTRRPPK